MEKYLDRCLTSLILPDEQMDQLEVLVINDGSKDRSSEIAHSYEARYPQTFRVVDKENGNYGSCVNKGMELATGKYFRILDADDWFCTSVLETFINSLSCCISDVIVTKYSSYEPKGAVFHYGFDNGKDPGIIYNVKETGLRPYSWFHMHQLTFKTDILRLSDFMLQHGISYTDTEFCYFPSKIIQSLLFLDLDLYQYDNNRPGQTMSSEKRKQSISQMLAIAKRLIPDYVAFPDGPNKELMLCSIKRIVLLFYETSLLECDGTNEEKNLISEFDSLVCQIQTLKDNTDRYYYRGVYYVRLWRRHNITYKHRYPIYNALWECYKKIKISYKSTK